VCVGVCVCVCAKVCDMTYMCEYVCVCESTRSCGGLIVILLTYKRWVCVCERERDCVCVRVCVCLDGCVCVCVAHLMRLVYASHVRMYTPLSNTLLHTATHTNSLTHCNTQ